MKCLRPLYFQATLFPLCGVQYSGKPLAPGKSKEKTMKTLTKGLIVVFTVFCLFGCAASNTYTGSVAGDVLLGIRIAPFLAGKYIREKLEPSRLYDTGVAHLKNGRYEEAVKSFDSAIKIDGQNADYHVQRALAYKEWGRTGRAFDSAEEACELGKCEVLEELLAGSDAFELGEEARMRSRRSIVYYNIAIKKNPKHAQAYYKRGLETSSYRKAVNDFTQVIKLEPDFADAYHERAKTYVLMNEHSKALADFNELVRLKPNDANSDYARADFYGKTGEQDKVIQDFTKAIKLEPNVAEAYYNYANFCLSHAENSETSEKEEAKKKAVELSSEAVRLYPNDPKVYYYRAVILDKVDGYRNRDKAMEDLTRAIELDPAYAEAYYKRARILERDGRCGYGEENTRTGCHNMMIAEYSHVIKLDPDFTEAYLSRAKIYRILGRNAANYEKAVKDYTQAIRIEPNNAKHYLSRASAYYWSAVNEDGKLENILDRENEINDIITACKLGDCEEYECMEQNGTLQEFISAKEKVEERARER
jgi:tetratricopeptide (TPR) repeat protein